MFVKEAFLKICNTLPPIIFPYAIFDFLRTAILKSTRGQLLLYCLFLSY